MTCKEINLGGAVVITCSRGRKRAAPCDVCKEREHTLLCDYELRGLLTASLCSRKLCKRCATKRGGKDLCPPHAKEGAPT